MELKLNHFSVGGFSGPIRSSHKSHDASIKYPTMHRFVTEMRTHVRISVTKWCIVEYGTVALLDLRNRSIGLS